MCKRSLDYFPSEGVCCCRFCLDIFVFVFVVALVVGCGFRLWSVFCFVPLCSVTAILFFLRQRWSRKPEDKA